MPDWKITSASATVSGGESTPPPSVPAGWTVEVEEYGATVTGQPMARIRITVNERPAGTTYFCGWFYRGAAAPEDVSSWTNGPNQPISAEGATYLDWWVNREDADYVLQVTVTASNSRNFVTPKSDATVQPVTVEAAEPAPQVTGFTVEAKTGDNGGVPVGWYEIDFTKPTSMEYWTTRVERIWCDSTFTPVPGAEWLFFGTIVKGVWTGEVWPLPTDAEYWQFRAKTETRAGLINETLPPTVNVTVPASTGLGSGVPPPEQLTGSDFSITVPEYGAKLNGQPQARVRITVTAQPDNTDYFSAWAYKGSSPPSDPSAYVNIVNQPKAASGSTHLDWWVDRDSVDTTYQITVRSSNGRDFGFATATSPVKSVVVEAPDPAPQVTGFSVTVTPDDAGGVPVGYYRVVFTPPASTEYWTTRVERIWCDSSFNPVPGADWELFGTIVDGAWEGDPWPLPTGAEYWKFRARTETRAGLINNTSPPTVNVTVPASSGVGTTAPAPPVTGVTASHRYTDYGDGRGPRLELVANYTDPASMGTFDGAVVYYELSDQSNAPAAVVGETTADGTHNAGGEWRPIRGTTGSVGKKPLVIPDLDPVDKPTVMRLIVNSLNTAQVESALVRPGTSGATPSATVTVNPPPTGAKGEEFCANPTGCTVDSNTAAMEGGVLVRRIKTSWTRPAGCDGAYIEVVYTDPNGAETINVAVAQGNSGENWFPEPKVAQTATIRWRGYVDQHPGVEDDLVNSYAKLITPETTLSIGTGTGTVDLGEGIAATVAASMNVVNKVLTVAQSGITEDLIAIFAVSQDRLKNAQIIDAARVVDQAISNSKLGSLSVDTSKLASGAVNNDKLAALAVAALNLVDSAVTETKIAALAVGNGAIANLAVGNSKIQTLAVATANLQDFAATNGKIANLAVTGLKVADAAIGTLQLVDTAVTTAKIQNLAVTNGLIAALAVGTAHIQDLAVTSAKIASLDVSKLNAGTVSVAITLTSPTIVGGSISGVTLTGTNTFSGNLATSGDVNAQGAVLAGGGLYVQSGTNRVVGPRQAAISNPFGGAVIDGEARTAIINILNAMRTHGLIWS